LRQLCLRKLKWLNPMQSGCNATCTTRRDSPGGLQGLKLFQVLAATVLWTGLESRTANAADAAAEGAPRNPLSFFDGGLVFDVQERLRLEARDNTYDFNSARNVSTDDTFLLQRFRLGLAVNPAPW